MTAAYCIGCGQALDQEHRFCPRCGAERWDPADAAPVHRAPPGAGSQTFQPAAPSAPSVPRLRWLPFVFAAGAVFWLVELAQFAAIVAAPAGRDQLRQALIGAGIKQDITTVIIYESVIVFLFEVVAAALHAAAYFGLRRVRPWGWIAAVIVAAAWSLILVGIPVLVVLLRRETRQSFGIS
ncbi:MAG TPA: zinc ribbon domain-containing protein [Candidatus Dormibacteraeota bacterium]|nr:zinc ribbon domain-containing protein [Candidatus Dormibacteraeota bacterium]